MAVSGEMLQLRFIESKTCRKTLTSNSAKWFPMQVCGPKPNATWAFRSLRKFIVVGSGNISGSKFPDTKLIFTYLSSGKFVAPVSGLCFTWKINDYLKALKNFNESNSFNGSNSYSCDIVTQFLRIYLITWRGFLFSKKMYYQQQQYGYHPIALDEIRKTTLYYFFKTNWMLLFDKINFLFYETC